MLNPNVETFLGCDAAFEDAGIVLFGAPFDSTTSFRPGPFASKAMRSESFGLETYSPYLDKDLTDCRIFDSGDLELCFGDANLALNHIESRAAEILEAGKLPVMIGGEHLVTLGAVRAAVKRYPDLHVVHFDAHADLRDDYLGAGCPTPQCSAGSGIGGRRPDLPIRHPCRRRRFVGREHVFTRRFDFKGLEETVAALQKKPVYFTLDLDVLDPSVFPGTGTPEAAASASWICWERSTRSAA